MNIFSYLEILKLDKSKLENLRNRDYIQLEKKLNTKSVFNSSIDKKEIPEFIKKLKSNSREINLFFKPSFYGLRKIIQNPDRVHTFELKESPNPLITDKLIQYIDFNFREELTQYSDFCIQENNLGSISSLLEYKKVIPNFINEKIETYLTQKLFVTDSYLSGNLNTSLVDIELIKNRFFYSSLSKLNKLEIENSILKFQKNIENQLLVKEFTPTTFTIIDSIKYFNTDNLEINTRKEDLLKKKEEIVTVEKETKKYVQKSETTYQRKYTSDYSEKGSWKIVLSIVLMLITIIRFCARNNNRSSTTNTYYEEQEPMYQARDYEIKKIQKDLIYIHTTKEITNTQKEEFNYSRMKFISKYDKYSFPGAHTIIKNKTNKKVVFFYNTDFGGFKYKLLEAKEESTLTLRYEYFFIFRGDDQHYCVYTDTYGESKVGVLYNEFDDNDMKLLKKLYTNDFQKLRKQSEIIISENGVEINEKS